MIGETQFNPYINNASTMITPSAGAASAGEVSSPVTDTPQPMDFSTIELSAAGASPPASPVKKSKPVKAAAAPSGPAVPQKKPSSEAGGVKGNLIKIPIIHTNDLHGAEHTLPLVEKMIDQLKSQSPDAILIDSGDAGNTADAADPDRFGRVVDFFNHEGYTAVCPGNHEFQWGKDVAVNEFFKKLDAKVVNANVLDPSTGKPLDGTVPYIIENIKGVNVGFVGITTTKMATPQHPDMGKDVNALPEVKTLEKEVEEMKQKGADVIVALMHKGISDVRQEGTELSADEEKRSMEVLRTIASKVPEVDVIAAGHDHKTANEEIQTGPVPHKTYIVEAGSHGDEVGEIDLAIDPATKQVVSADMNVYPTKKFVTTAPDDGEK